MLPRTRKPRQLDGALALPYYWRCSRRLATTVLRSALYIKRLPLAMIRPSKGLQEVCAASALIFGRSGSVRGLSTASLLGERDSLSLKDLL